MSAKLVKGNKLLYIMLFSLVVIGFVIFSNFLSISNTEKVIFDQLKKEQLIETEFTAILIESHVLQVKEELVTLSKFPLMETLDVNACTGNMKIIHEKIEGKINSLMRVDKEGNIIECSSPKFSDYVGLNIKNKDYFKIPKETDEPFVAGSVRQGERQHVIVTAPLFKTTEYTPYPNFRDEFEGLLMSIIDLDDIYRTYIHRFVDKEKTFFLLINRDTQETLLKSEGLDEYSMMKEQLPELAGGSTNISSLKGFGSTIITSSDISLGSETWKLIIMTPLKNVGSDIKSAQRRNIFSLGFVIIVIVSTLIFLLFVYKTKEEAQVKLEQTNVTLKNFGINIQLEENNFNQAEITLDAKNVYLIKEDEENHAYELFISSLNKGFAGMGIVREDPRKVKKKYNLQKTSFIWLTSVKAEDVPCEVNIDNLYLLISEFIKKSEKSVILLDRLDYILTENKFEDVIKMLHSLKDMASAHECIILISLNPLVIDEPSLKAIEAETVDLYGKHLRKRVELSDIEMNILKYVNEKNVSNKLASYGDITENFKITKPTTRVKIDKLQKLGLLGIEQKGRFKSIKITSAGRRII